MNAQVPGPARRGREVLKWVLKWVLKLGAIRTRGCSSQGAPCTGPAAACTGGPVLGRASSLQAPRAEPGPRAPREARKGEPTEAARAREPVLGRPLRPAPSSGASACFCFRAGGLCAWGLALRVSGGRPAPRTQPKASRARWQEPAQAPAQQALQPRDQALQPQGGPHCQPFPMNKDISFRTRGTRKN